MPDFYLASHSARRRELLLQVGADFGILLVRVAPPRGPDLGEEQHPGESAADYVTRVAREKAQFGLRMLAARALPLRPVLGADTTVILDGTVLGKPRDDEEAAAFLRRLSGRMHEVRTAVALALPGPAGMATDAGAAGDVREAVSVSQVRLRTVDEREIARYCATGEPRDKAGGYGLQGRAALFVDRIEGSYSGIVGLPLAETAHLLAHAAIPLL